ncbi:C4-dicarboxylate ABC transporter permease [Actinophytocola xinjiangensis]|uniref:C4-dicarboxylate ABC transporter permease n=1 Tax=Actinophytocola xinjiangensis TaxID=485602 RepID=A0A7Z0WIL9_9PSEU|nr:TRAP transporter small permease [Actinophytocola xinjiangensis]OLF06999.1 C4-dicarboxylate ABC transporter permease [Actinophytocola xinjiangensis]
MIRRVWRAIDAVFEGFTVSCLVAVTFVLLWQVFGREVLGNSPAWSEETARMLLVWLGFLAAAIGFREGAHIAITFLVNRFPTLLRRAIEWLITGLVLLFGLYLIVQGSEFAIDTRHATLPGTGLPRSMLYVAMPLAGLMIVLYTTLRILGVDTARLNEETDEAIDKARADGAS